MVQLSKVKAILFFLCLMFSHESKGQSLSLADSLYQTLSTVLPDTQRVQNLNDLAWELMYEHGDSSRQYLKESLELCRKINFKKGEGQVYNTLGVVNEIAGNSDEALTAYQKALVIREELNDKKGLASIHNNLGSLEEQRGNYDLAFISFRKSLLLRKELKDTIRIAEVLYNMGYLQERMGNYPEALDFALQHLELIKEKGDNYSLFNANSLLGSIKTESELYQEAQSYYEKALKMAKEINEPYELSIAYNNIGIMLDDKAMEQTQKKAYRKALSTFNQSIEYLTNSLDIRIKNQDKIGTGDVYNNLGVIQKNIGNLFLDQDIKDSANVHFYKALNYLEKALDIQISLDNKKGIIQIQNGLGDVYRRLGNHKKALSYTKNYLALAKETQDQKFIQKAYKDLSRVYEKQGAYKKAFTYRKQYDEIKYERFNEDNIKKNARREALYGDYQKELENAEQEKEILKQEAKLARAQTLQYSLIAGAMVLFIIALLLYNRYRIKNKANKALAEKNQIIKQEKKRSDDLLLNILPEETAQELKQHGKAAAKSYEAVTVLFSDIVSFTSIAEGLKAEDLVKMLDECFQAFDEISKKYSIEKIKTIGDAYMSVGGLPIPDENHAINVIQAGLAMQAFSSKFNASQRSKGLPEFQIRIGIHTGPVVAGIVGSSKFAYDIWGDTVNLASRMESAGEAGRVNISRSTYELVKDHFNTSYRGKIKVKNKGEVEMFFIESPQLS